MRFVHPALINLHFALFCCITPKFANVEMVSLANSRQRRLLMTNCSGILSQNCLPMSDCELTLKHEQSSLRTSRKGCVWFYCDAIVHTENIGFGVAQTNSTSVLARLRSNTLKFRRQRCLLITVIPCSKNCTAHPDRVAAHTNCRFKIVTHSHGQHHRVCFQTNSIHNFVPFFFENPKSNRFI